MPILPTADLVGQMLAKIVDTTDSDRSFVPFKGDGTDEVVLLVNNLGSISELELGGIAHEGEFSARSVCDSYGLIRAATSWLQHKGYRVKRVLAGTYMTSLNMPGFSLSLLLLPRQDDKEGYTSDQILQLLDAPANAPGWKWYSKAEPGTLRAPAEASHAVHTDDVALARKSWSGRARIVT